MNETNNQPLADDTTVSDEELMRRFVDDSGACAFDALYRRYRDRLKIFLQRDLLTREDAEEVIQDVFIRVLDKKHLFNPQAGSFKAWLFTIAKHQALNRRRWLERTVPFAEETKPKEEHHAISVEQIPAEQPGQSLMDILGQIPDNSDRLIVTLLGDGFSRRDVANLIGISQATLHRRIARIFRELQKVNRPTGYHTGGPERMKA